MTVNPAPIYVNLSVALWASSQSLTSYEPKHLTKDHKHFAEDKRTSLNTKILPNKRIYVSDPFSSTDRAWFRPAILLRASRHRFRTRT